MTELERLQYLLGNWDAEVEETPYAYTITVWKAEPTESDLKNLELAA